MDAQKLLPDEVRSPWLFLVVHVLPQAVLSLILWRAWDLVSGEVSAAGRGAYLTIFGMQVGIVVAAAAVGVTLLRRGARVRWPVGLAFLVLNIAVLWTGLALCADLVPRTVADWMISPAQLVFGFLCLVGPALFYNALCVAGLSLPFSLAADISGSVATLVLIPSGWYILTVVGYRFFSFVRIPFAVGMTIFVICTALVAFVFLRLLLWLCRAARGRMFVPALLGGLVFPFGGLALNTYIPFPVNLQYGPVYAFTAINGILLLLPMKAEHPTRQWVWFARIAMYPFSLYFFLLFLPFLPLSIPAMIAAGAGFLILAPVFLFVVHSRMIFDETRALGSAVPRAKLVGLFAAAVLLLPTGYVIRAALHRTALMCAVEAVYTPDLAVEKPLISPGITRMALRRLQNMKEGLYMPFLSEIYNRIVFNGMVLPDYNVKRISEEICGEDLSQRPPRNGRWGVDFPDLFLNGRGRSRRGGNVPSPRDVTLKEVRITSVTTNGPLVEARLEVDLQNDAQPGAEYVGSIEVPPSVSVSGFELDMKGEWVEGRMFDRKSALWVYHMIRDTTRRDPGLLVYTDSRHLKLSVFPFEPSELRHCAIRLTFLAGDTAGIAVADERLELGRQAGVPAPIVQVPLKGGGAALYIPGEPAARLPSMQRPVCVHFLLDASALAVESLPLYSERIEEFLARNPLVTNTAATAVNVGSEPIYPAGTAPDLLRNELTRKTSRIKARGGYGADTAIRRILFKELTASAPSPYATVFVLVTGTNAVPLGGLDDMLAMVPDARVIDDRGIAESVGTPVVQIASGETWALLSAGSGGWVFAGGDAERMAFEVRGGSQDAGVTPTVRMSVDSRWQSVAAIRKLASRQILYPSMADSLRAEMLSTARAGGILAPETAYMVVENSAQWKTLERAEKTSLGANSALEFDEFKTPEPDVWIILVGFAGWLALRRLFVRGGNGCDLLP